MQDPMTLRRRRKSLAVKTFELGLAAPQVIAHRLARMDHAEFHRMGFEKIAAANEAWVAMGLQAFLEHQKLMQSFWFPWLRRPSATGQWNRILGKGMAPIHRRAVANAKRLGRLKRR